MAGPHTTRDGAIGVVSLDAVNPRLTMNGLRLLTAALERTDADPQTSVILLSGPAGTFCGGGDLASFLGCGDLDELSDVVRRFLLALVRMEKPLIAAVDGEAVGLGMTMLLHFDAVFATPESSFVAPFTDLGLTPEAGSTLLAPARFGHLRAFELLCLGRPLSAAEAFDIGLITSVTPSGQAYQGARAVASQLARKPQGALRATRRLLRGESEALANRVDVEIAHFRRQLEDAATARRLLRITRRLATQRSAA